jgi:hypothetical protein
MSLSYQICEGDNSPKLVGLSSVIFVGVSPAVAIVDYSPCTIYHSHIGSVSVSKSRLTGSYGSATLLILF